MAKAMSVELRLPHIRDIALQIRPSHRVASWPTTGKTAGVTTSEIDGGRKWAVSGRDEAEMRARSMFGSALRRLHHAFVGRQISSPEIEEGARALSGLAAHYEAFESRSRSGSEYEAERELEHAVGAALPTFGDRPFSGAFSPFALEFEVVRESENCVRAEFTLGPAHEGAPDRSHGGIVAGFFDDLTGYVLQLAQVQAFTGELTVRYLAPVPLGLPLVGRAWLVDRVDRKLFMEADLRSGEQVVATSKALYICPRP